MSEDAEKIANYVMKEIFKTIIFTRKEQGTYFIGNSKNFAAIYISENYSSNKDTIINFIDRVIFVMGEPIFSVGDYYEENFVEFLREIGGPDDDTISIGVIVAFAQMFSSPVASTFNVDPILTTARLKNVYRSTANTVPMAYGLKSNPVTDAFGNNIPIGAEIERKIQLQTEAALKLIQNSASEFQHNITDQIKAAAEAIKVGQELRAAFELWEGKEERHRELFVKGCWIFCGLIVAFTVAIFLGWNGIKEIVSLQTADGDGTQAAFTTQLISRFVIVSLPLAIGVWLLRAVLRWTNLNLSLAEDAAQRAVLAKTYVNLVAEKAVTQDQDRHIMLTALFRPLPGVKDLDVSPTTIRDIVDPPKGK